MTENELQLILVALQEIRGEIGILAEDFRAHVSADMRELRAFRDALMKARGMAVILVPIVSAIVSVIVGYVLKHL